MFLNFYRVLVIISGIQHLMLCITLSALSLCTVEIHETAMLVLGTFGLFLQIPSIFWLNLKCLLFWKERSTTFAWTNAIMLITVWSLGPLQGWPLAICTFRQSLFNRLLFSFHKDLLELLKYLLLCHVRLVLRCSTRLYFMFILLHWGVMLSSCRTLCRCTLSLLSLRWFIVCLIFLSLRRLRRGGRAFVLASTSWVFSLWALSLEISFLSRTLSEAEAGWSETRFPLVDLCISVDDCLWVHTASLLPGFRDDFRWWRNAT